MAYYESAFLAGYKKRFNVYQGLSSGEFKNGKTTAAKGLEKIRQNIITLFSVDQGDVFFNPSFGSSLQPYLFEPNDFILKDTLDRLIRSQIKQNIPNVRVDNIDIQFQDINIHIEISIYATTLGQYDTINIIKRRGVITFD